MVDTLYSAGKNSAVIAGLKELLPDQFRKQTATSATETNTNVLIECFNHPQQELENAIFGLLDTFNLYELTPYTTKLISDLIGSPNLTDYDLLQYLIAGYCAAKVSSGTAFDVAQAFKSVIASTDAATFQGNQTVWGEASALPISGLTVPYTDEEIAAFCNTIMQRAVASGVRWDGIGINDSSFMLDISDISDDNTTGDELGDYYTS